APDVMESHLIAEELNAAGVAPPIANQGISMLVPTLLELGTEEQKRAWIAPTLRGEIVWCQGYSEPGAGSDLAPCRPVQSKTARTSSSTARRSGRRQPMSPT